MQQFTRSPVQQKKNKSEKTDKKEEGFFLLLETKEKRKLEYGNDGMHRFL